MRRIEQRYSEEDDRRIKLWSDAGLSCGAIGERLGRTRNSVSGRRHRLGITGDKLPARPEVKPRNTVKPRKPKVAVIKSKPKRVVTAPWQQPAPVFPSALDGFGEKDYAVYSLQSHHCRWPIGHPKDDDFRFCSANRRVAGPYCNMHHAIAYNGIPQRRAR